MRKQLVKLQHCMKASLDPWWFDIVARCMRWEIMTHKAWNGTSIRRIWMDAETSWSKSYYLSTTLLGWLRLLYLFASICVLTTYFHNTSLCH
ncbi:hypothetical protein P171DRAFT_27044 [Karstenula rhodostoma CBS 690.94]|uniref:Uncharacterized protein n=1 Tax=Karstenula rhodostoma CBS 690.94 TaxID=1392251 RepID=A0A9P4UBF1_9PLEO|nr:hypothetical protein P171DRAFT_27044 [Karstenula rhodostoma CBS 690.94]